MSSRIIISLLCAGALAFACGPRSRSQVAATVGVISQRPSPTRADSTLSSSFGVHVEHATVKFALSVVNLGKKHVELTFPSGEAYDFVVVDSAGREVWRWTQGRMFTQSVRTKLLATGDAMRIDERWDRPVAHGKYTAIAMLKSSNHPVEERVDFEIQ